MDSESLIFGYQWADIDHVQRRNGVLHRSVNTAPLGDHGADPIANGKFRMVPSGDIVDMEERNRRLDRYRNR